jgi:23S rRNA pseudouridine1911/1915/1917 synthase
LDQLKIMTNAPGDTPYDMPDDMGGDATEDRRQVVIGGDSIGGALNTVDDAGQRLDLVLTRVFPDLSRSRVQALIKGGAVSRADGSIVDAANLRVKLGDAFVVAVPAPEDPIPHGEDIPLTIIHEDRAVIVIDKPAGLVVHPAAGHATGTLVNALIFHCGDTLSGIGGVRRPGIVHRLDKDTSGLMVIAKTDAAHQSLTGQFAAHGADGRLERGYAAIVWGVPEPRSGRIATFIGRKNHDRTRMAVVREEHGRHAATRYEVAGIFPAGTNSAHHIQTALVRCTLETGRTHQVRVHLAHLGHPLLGDAVYGTGFNTRIPKLGPEAQKALAALARQALHAELLAFEHPVSGKPMRFTSKLPSDIARLRDALSGDA